jgi:hypothetical protein
LVSGLKSKEMTTLVAARTVEMVLPLQQLMHCALPGAVLQATDVSRVPLIEGGPIESIIERPIKGIRKMPTPL